jgi:hypothetical protein
MERTALELAPSVQRCYAEDAYSATVDADALLILSD